ncbi:melatonin receptor type 1B-A-like [Paramacrobiotus metropolitanus]|uniref:melatonin receptor type 1B-A-like n=1 Tax=Paramacrobiotus metropolitanus TaxID=2943436 RepID=UPI00244657A0|nr:melatonin receptor type 1B-A-like [Paramacrobiotus metropolitanus]
MNNATDAVMPLWQYESHNDTLWIRVAFIIVMIVLSIAGFVGNAMIIITILLVRELRSTQNAFLVNLAVSDLALILIVVPFNIISVVHGKLFWADRMPLCIFVASVCAPGCLTAIWSNTGTAFNRYFFMCKNDIYDQLFSPRKTVLWILAIWAISFLIHMPNHLGWGENSYVEQFYLCTRETNLWTYSTFFAVVGIVLPIAISFFAYFNIYLLVRRTKSARNIIIKMRNPKPPTTSAACSASCGSTLESSIRIPLVSLKSDDDKAVKALVAVNDALTLPVKHCNRRSKAFWHEILLAQTLLRSFMLFLVSWLPLAILLMLPMVPIPAWIHLGSLLLAHGSTATNAILIYSSDKRFRHGARNLYNRWRGIREGFTESGTGTSASFI